MWRYRAFPPPSQTEDQPPRPKPRIAGGDCGAQVRKSRECFRTKAGGVVFSAAHCVEVNIHEAKTQLSRLIERALKGEEVTIAKAGHPLVRLNPLQAEKPVLGSARGLVKIARGWDRPMTDEEVEISSAWLAARQKSA